MICWFLVFSECKQEVQYNVPYHAGSAAEEGKGSMAGDDSLEDTVADEDQAAYEERDDFQLLGLERFEAEERDLGVE